MKPVVDRLKEKYSDKINFFILNTNDPETSVVASKYRVRLVPTFLLFDKNGKLAETLVGAQEESSLADKLNQQIHP